MKTKKLLVSLVLVGMMVLTAFGTVGCWQINEEGTAKDLQIHIWESGFGSDFLFDLADAYMEQHDDVEIEIVNDSNMSCFYQTISSGVEANEYDLYFDYGPKYRQYSAQGYLEDLSEVMKATPEGESKPIEEKIYDLQQKKSKLIDDVLSTNTTFINRLSKDDILNLFS